MNINAGQIACKGDSSYNCGGVIHQFVEIESYRRYLFNLFRFDFSPFLFFFSSFWSSVGPLVVVEK